MSIAAPLLILLQLQAHSDAFVLLSLPASSKGFAPRAMQCAGGSCPPHGV
jgi:hypothetical protein